MRLTSHWQRRKRQIGHSGKLRKPHLLLKKKLISSRQVLGRHAAPHSRGDVLELRNAVTFIRQIGAAASQGDEGELIRLHNFLRRQIHRVEYASNLSEALVDESRITGPNGIDIVVQNARGHYPYDLVADCKVLARRWGIGDYDPYLLRGTETKSFTQTGGKGTKARSLVKEYAFKMSPNFVGTGHLQNGQWWPHQLTAMRDGAHGAIEAGIYGEKGKGALSVVLGSSRYANEDHGERILYCGTSGKLEKPTENTNLMMESRRLQRPVRVLRSGAGAPHKHSVYQPIVGIRYDGLYIVTEQRLLDLGTAMYQFTLRRSPGQDPIRYKSVESRPTPEERAAYSDIREALGYSS